MLQGLTRSMDVFLLCTTLNRVEGVSRMTDGIVRNFERDRLMVFDSPGGKLIVYLLSFEPDVYRSVTVGLPPEAIEQLKKKSQKKSFEWTTEDGSLSIQGQDGCWRLLFRMSIPPYSIVPVFLCTAETQTIKEHLFTQ